VSQRPHTLPERNLGDLLNETFAIYTRHFWRLIALVAVVQVPVSLVTLLVTLTLKTGPAAYGTVGAFEIVGAMLIFGAVVFAVGQLYVSGEVRIGECYGRVWHRVVSLALVTLALMACLAFGAALAALILPAVLMAYYMVRWSLSVPALVVERHKTLAALKRSSSLVAGSWARVLGVLVVIGLVMLGLGLLLDVPFALVARIASPEGGDGATAAIQSVARLVVAVGVLPVAPVALTLLYYDLRVRKEDYDFATLSREVEAATA
jgi:hypothetical protein